MSRVTTALIARYIYNWIVFFYSPGGDLREDKFYFRDFMHTKMLYIFFLFLILFEKQAAVMIGLFYFPSLLLYGFESIHIYVALWGRQENNKPDESSHKTAHWLAANHKKCPKVV